MRQKKKKKGETTLEKVIARALLINQYQVVRVRFEGGTRQMARLYVSRVGTKREARGRAIRLVSKCRKCKRFAVGPETRHSVAMHKRSARFAVAL